MRPGMKILQTSQNPEISGLVRKTIQFRPGTQIFGRSARFPAGPETSENRVFHSKNDENSGLVRKIVHFRPGTQMFSQIIRKWLTQKSAESYPGTHLTLVRIRPNLQ